MTTVVVDPGICGFVTTVEVVRLTAHRVRVSITSGCEMVNEMNSQLSELNWSDALRQPEQSVVYKRASQHIGHCACPVPMAILKAIEVEVGAALPQDVVVRFEPIQDE